MKYYWKVRCYFPNGSYHHAQIETVSDWRMGAAAIDCIQDFYHDLTGCKMLIEGMADYEDKALPPIQAVFPALLKNSDPNHEPKSAA